MRQILVWAAQAFAGIVLACILLAGLWIIGCLAKMAIMELITWLRYRRVIHLIKTGRWLR